MSGDDVVEMIYASLGFLVAHYIQADVKPGTIIGRATFTGDGKQSRYPLKVLGPASKKDAQRQNRVIQESGIATVKPSGLPYIYRVEAAD